MQAQGGWDMSNLRRTLFYDRHVALKGKMVEFGGWEMPVFYPSGIVTEHLTTRRTCGLFDVSHMGRFVIRGSNAAAFLQHVLTGNVQALEPGLAQYTIIANETGGAVDDAYLYRFTDGEYLLVVNAANRQKDWDHFQAFLPKFQNVELTDSSDDMVMLAFQGPSSRGILEGLIQSGRLPEPMRNHLSVVTIDGAEVMVGRTGYTGEPLCFELFAHQENGLALWDRLIEKGAAPVGLGARDTLRLEAGMPLYGHEFGDDFDGKEIPILSNPLARVAVSFSPLKGDYVGRAALARQHEALKRIMVRDYSLIADLPRMVKPFAMVGRGVGRAEAKVFKGGNHIGWVTSGTTVPMWVFDGEGLESAITEETKIRAIGLAYLDSDVIEGDVLEIEIRRKMVEAVVVPYHLRSEAPPYARPIPYLVEEPEELVETDDTTGKVANLIRGAVANHTWRQRECVNLIPSEMTISPMVRLLCVTDPAYRYGEHRTSAALEDAEVFYYQGTEFIARVEQMLEAELIKFMGCKEIETRVISGQMANMAVFSAMLDYINRVDRKSEPRRIRSVMNNHIGKGGHLSAQPMGALRDFVARDPQTERPAVVNFPVRPEDRFRINVPAALELVEQHRPELIIFGKSMVLYKEPVADIRKAVDELGLDTIVMYDMAHVLGLVGPHFQMPFQEGADLVTGSTHKTYFGTQRGVAASRFEERDVQYPLWQALQNRTFPGSVSNHHLGTLLGLLMAAYEMNHFKDEYQRRVIANAKAFANALHDCGLDVAGDSSIGFTETHQVIVSVGYGRGPEIARRLEENNIICNYQAGPDEEGFTAAGALRCGVSEMTRFGMEENDFEELAPIMADVVLKNTKAVDRVKAFREKFLDLQFCFRGDEYAGMLESLHQLI
jgi:aminomethyltransferase